MSGFSSPLLRENLAKMSLGQKLRAVPRALWSRTTRRIRMLGAFILFLYVPLALPHLLTHVLTPAQLPLLLAQRHRRPRIPRAPPLPRIPAAPLQRLQSRPPNREPPRPHPRPPNPPFHLRRAPRLALPLHGLPGVRDPPQQVRRRPRAGRHG